MKLPKGVCSDHPGYSARISVKGESVYLGYFDTAEQAGDAYVKARKQYDRKEKMQKLLAELKRIQDELEQLENENGN